MPAKTTTTSTAKNASTKKDKVYLGIDMGGTTVKFSMVDHAGTILSSDAVHTDRNMESIGAVTELAQAIYDSCGEGASSIEAIGLAVPGAVGADDSLNMIVNVNLDLTAFVEALTSIFGANVYPVNDANAAALGEMWKGAGAVDSTDSLVFVTLGTGVGGGVVIDGNILTGAFGAAGEVGHLTIEPDGELCNCGRKGCLEMYTSARGLLYLYLEQCKKDKVEPIILAHDTDALAVFTAARYGDTTALAAIDTMATYLAKGLATIACIIDPACFAIGGGMSGAFDMYEDKLVEEYKKNALPACRDARIVKASLGNSAGVLGAAKHAANRSKK